MKYCPKCGKELNDNDVLCTGCGTSFKKTKKLFKKWWFWVVVVIVVIVISSSLGEGENSSSTGDALNSQTAVTQSADESKASSDENSSVPELTYEEEIATYNELDFETLSRNPDKYKGEKLKFTGQVIQVQEPSFGNTVELRINVTKKTYEYIDDVTWTDTIYATVELPDGADRILEEDVITFYGSCEGLYSYTSVLGSKISLPKISIKYWELIE